MGSGIIFPRSDSTQSQLGLFEYSTYSETEPGYSLEEGGRRRVLAHRVRPPTEEALWLVPAASVARVAVASWANGPNSGAPHRANQFLSVETVF